MKLWSGFLLVGLLLGQDATIRTTTRLVTIDVVARDKDGKFAQGLSASDFTVTDNGKKQDIRVFRRPADAQTPDSIAARMQLPEDLPANVFTNFKQTPTQPKAVTVILFDGLNTPIEDQRYARLQIVKFLEQLKPDDRVGLYVVGQRLKILHDFSSDAKSLLAELGKFRGETFTQPATESTFAQLLDSAKLDKILSDGGEAQRAMDQIAADQNIAVLKLKERAQRTFYTLEAIAQHLAPVPGRKNLLWVSASFPMVVGTDLRTGTGSPESFEYMAGRAARAIANAGVSIYPVDARGVMVDVMYRAKTSFQDYAMGQVVALSRSRGGRRDGKAKFTSPDPLVHADRDETVSHHDLMEDLAKRTGGRAFYSSNDIAKSIREAIDDSGDNYVLGYYPADYEDNGRYRRIQVKTGKAGISLRHRDGYYAAELKPQQDQQQREAMWDAMSGPLSLSAIPMAVQCERLADRLRVTMRLDAAALTMREIKGSWQGAFEVVLLYLDAKGQGKGGSEKSVPFDLPTADRDKALASGFNYQLDLPLIDGAKILAVGIKDSASGRVGTMQIEMSKLSN
jgi:VWFA-related protein